MESLILAALNLFDIWHYLHLALGYAYRIYLKVSGPHS